MRRLWVLAMAAGATLLPGAAAAQGCEPIRFTTPIDLGGEGRAYQRGYHWTFTLAYRRLHSSDFYVGSEQHPELGPIGAPPVFDIHTVVADVAYSINERIRVRLSLPFSTGSLRKKWADSAYHSQRASGFGDLSALADLWLLNPRTHPHGNVALGLGLKAPTGSHTKAEQFYTATAAVPFFAEQTVQPGDGGWGLSFQVQGFQRVREGLYLYGFGFYQAGLRDSTEVPFAPAGATAAYHWSVPDVYLARLGASFAVWPSQGLSLSLGGRLDGIPRHDLLGGGDSAVKRSSRIVYADPGVSFTRGNSSFSLSLPLRLHVNRMKSDLESRTPAAPKPLNTNGGGFAKYLLFLSYSYRL